MHFFALQIDQSVTISRRWHGEVTHEFGVEGACARWREVLTVCLCRSRWCDTQLMMSWLGGKSGSGGRRWQHDKEGRKSEWWWLHVVKDQGGGDFCSGRRWMKNIFFKIELECPVQPKTVQVIDSKTLKNLSISKLVTINQELI